MKNYKLYIFDLDDTLINTFYHASNIIYPKLAKKIGVEIPNKNIIRENWNKIFSDSINNIFKTDISTEQIIEELSNLFEKYKVRSFSGVKNLLEILKKHNKSIALLTSSPQNLMNINLKNGLALNKDYFDTIFNVPEQKIEKTSPKVIEFFKLHYQQKYNKDIKSSEILYIGDSLGDYKAALKFKIDFIAVLTGVTKSDDFIKNGLSENLIFNAISDAFIAPEQHGIVAIIQNNQKQFLLIKEARKNNPYFGCWAGPHGKCKPSDILEEETVVRETFEECGIYVQAVKKIHTSPADTKIKTVSFWDASFDNEHFTEFNISKKEVSQIKWFSLDEILQDKIQLYPGTKKFFTRFKNKYE